MHIKLDTFPNTLFIKGSHSRVVKPFFQRLKTDDTFFQNTLLWTMILSNIYKTGVYVITSLKAKNAPDDQRKLAASLSLVNGTIALATMGTIGNAINKHSAKWADNMFKNLTVDPKLYNLAKLGFRSFLTVGVVGVFVQKFLVQYLSTPLAKWFRDRVSKAS